MWYVLILFLVNGEPTLEDGWYPIEADSYEHCLQLKDKIIDYMEDIDRNNSVIDCTFKNDRRLKEPHKKDLPNG